MFYDKDMSGYILLCSSLLYHKSGVKVEAGCNIIASRKTVEVETFFFFFFLKISKIYEISKALAAAGFK